MKWGLEVVLITFALVGYVGAGASLAVARYRSLEDGRLDVGMLGVAGMLILFAAVCTSVAVGPLGVAAVGAIAVWAAYVVMARQIGMFSLEISAPKESMPAPTPHTH